jgi:hypothetical protein
MKPPREAQCVEPIRFPQRPWNRPSLPHIGYRVGTYSDIRAALLRRLDVDPNLLALTYRGADDPAIALLDGAAIVGDILTFYQELYANEAFLRTATWRESIADLVRLIGYRLAPGLGGRSAFTLEVKGTRRVVVPRVFPIKADLADVEKTADFETIAETTAYPWLSRFWLYRPLAPQSLPPGRTTELTLMPADLQGDPVAIAKGDRLLVGTASAFAPPFDLNGAKVLVVDKVRNVQGQTIVTLKGELELFAWAGELVGMKIGRTFRHFGHNAPLQNIKIVSGAASATDVTYERLLNDTTDSTLVDDIDPELAAKDMPLDVQVNDLALGGAIAIQGIAMPIVHLPPGGPHNIYIFHRPAPFTAVRQIRAAQARTLRWGPLAGSGTLVSVDSPLGWASADIRTMSLHEVASAPFQVRALDAPTADARGIVLYCFGTSDQAQSLRGRDIILAPPDADSVRARAGAVGASVSPWGDARPARYPVTLDHEVDYAGFPTEDPTIPVYGNVVDATQGKTEQEAVLGDGDAGVAFQTFKLPKTPLTFLLKSGQTPPELPELEVRVGGRSWTYVPTLFGHGPDEEIYIVRQDPAGASWVQFGDGKTGARLLSGVENVSAVFRSGVGAHGPLKPQASPTPGGRLDGLGTLGMPGVATGGAQPEAEGHAREAAPGRVISLGRLVSLEDYESEALAVPGVSRAQAGWELVENIPTTVVTVILESGRGAEIDAIRQILARTDRCRGARRHPLLVRPGAFEYVFLDAIFAADPHLDPKAMTSAVAAALGVTGQEGNDIDGSHGLLALAGRRFGEAEYASRIEATIQDTDGVRWAKVRAFGSLGTADDPATLPLPVAPWPLVARLDCASDRILRLYDRGTADGPLRLTIAAVPPGECDG